MIPKMAAASLVEAHMGTILFSKIGGSEEPWICDPDITVLLNPRPFKARQSDSGFQVGAQFTLGLVIGVPRYPHSFLWISRLLFWNFSFLRLP